MRFYCLLIFAGLIFSSNAFGGGAGSIHLDDAEMVGTGSEVAVAADKSFLVVWQEQGVQGLGSTVSARELSSAGVAGDAERVLDSEALWRGPGLSVGSGADGEFVVAWSEPTDFYLTQGSHEIFAQRLDGTTPIGDVLPMQEASGDFTSIRGLETRDDGHFTVVWSNSFQYGPWSGRSQTFTPDDQVLGAASFDSPNTPNAIARDGDGFVVLTSSGPYFFNADAQRLAGDGTELGSEVTLHQRARDIAPSRGEGFLVVWRDAQNNFAQALGSDLAADGDPLQLNVANDTLSEAVVFEAPDGGFLTAWTIDDGNRAVRLRYLRPDGVLEDLLTLTGVTTSSPPKIAVDRYGRFLATWVGGGAIWKRQGSIDRTIGVDAFETAQPPISVSPVPSAGDSAAATATGLDIVGGERDIEVSRLSGTGGATLEVTGGQLLHRQASDVTARSTLTWDQADGDATALDADGLRALDLTSGMTRDALLVHIAEADAGSSLLLSAGDDTGTSTFTLDLPSGATAESFVMPFEDFTGDGDLTQVGFLSLTIDGSSATGIDVTLDRIATVSRLQARKTVRDLDGGELETGDVLEYTAAIENASDGLSATASSVAYSQSVPGGTALRCSGAGAPATSQGSVTGCVEGEGGQLNVELGELADSFGATVTWQVTVLRSAPTRICSDGLISSATVTDQLTDDPSTAVPADSTCIELGSMSPIPIFIDDFESGDLSAWSDSAP